MTAIKKLRTYLTPFQWFEVLAVIGFTIYFAVINHENKLGYTILSSISAVCGIFCVVLCAAGKKSQYYWGFVNIIAYVIVSWMNKYYGEVMLNALYFLPTQFVGMYFWKKHYNDQSGTVKSKKMSILLAVALLLISALCIYFYHLVLVAIGGRATWLDSISFILSLIANALMVLRYREQWFLWIIIDIITVAMWILAHDFIQTAMWSLYLLNAFYGLLMWSRMSKTDNIKNE